MRSHSGRRGIVVAIIAAGFLSFALVSASHWHSPTSRTSVQSDCLLCSLGGSAVDATRTHPSLLVSALVMAFVLIASKPERATEVEGLGAPRAPPLP